MPVEAIASTVFTREISMSSIMIHDLQRSDTLDRAAMSSIRGAGADWVFGWIAPYQEKTAGSFGVVLNFYQVNNYNIGQMINQTQNVKIDNSGANAKIDVNIAEQAKNLL